MNTMLEAVPAKPPATGNPRFWTAHPAVVRWLTALTVLVVGGWVAAGAAILGYWQPLGLAQHSAVPNHRNDSGEIAEAPWGEIVYVPITIAPPLELVPEMPRTTSEVAWSFPHTSANQMMTLLTEIGLSEPLQRSLLNLARFDATVDGMTIHPPQEMVLGLTPADRMRLYVTLAAYPQNLDQVNAFRFYSDSIDEWLDRMPLAAETRQLVRPLVYRRDGYLFFADLRSIEGKLGSSKERLLLLKCLSHEKTFLAKLRVPAGADIEPLVSYWSRGGRTKDIRPILDSLNDVEQGAEIDVIHLLPRFARGRIYTYPPPPEKLPALNRDCHWTSLNFFNNEPNDRYCDDAEVVRTIQQDYYRIFGNYQLGDLVMLFRGDDTIHSAIYIADDFVFTKNGNISSRPWMFMKLDAMQHYYPSLKPLELRVYRRKDV